MTDDFLSYSLSLKAWPNLFNQAIIKATLIYYINFVFVLQKGFKKYKKSTQANVAICKCFFIIIFCFEY